MQKSMGLRQLSKAFRPNMPSNMQNTWKSKCKVVNPTLRRLEDLICWMKHCSKR